MILSVDDFIEQPELYREEALCGDFRTYNLGGEEWHNIHYGESTETGLRQLKHDFPEFDCTLTFFRLSPLGQVEPNFIHTDIDMGKVTGILYLNPDPPRGDGTAFWKHKASGEIGSLEPHKYSAEGQNAEAFEVAFHVEAKFNRLLLFESHLFHSRRLVENWGQGEDGRLIQVFFGNGHF